MGFINMGFGNIINSDKILTIISPDSAPSKRLLQNSRDCGKVIDATQGRRTRSMIMTDTGFLVLSALLPETIAARVKNISRENYMVDTGVLEDNDESSEY